MKPKERPTVLIYRRTHAGDPNMDGVFGCNNCMGSARGWHYDAVIGIGGKCPDTGYEKLAYKVNWIGIGPTKTPKESKEPLVTFEKFALWEEKGLKLIDCAPELYRYLFIEGKVPRAGKNFPERVYKEILQLLEMVDNSKPSAGKTKFGPVNRGCRPKSSIVRKKGKCK